jgi:hypothetical protein
MEPGVTITLSAIVSLAVSLGARALFDFVLQDTLARRKADRDDELARRKADRDDELARRQVDREYRYERRKQLDGLIGAWKGRLLHAGLDLHVRIRNLGVGDPEWLSERTHVYESTVFRFLRLYRLLVGFEQDAIYLAPDVSRRDDRLLVRYARVLLWVMTDVRLFEGSGYEMNEPVDHFFIEQLRWVASFEDLPIEQSFTWQYFEESVKGTPRYSPVFDYFQDLNKRDLGWDRLIALDLVLLAFLDAVGFESLHRSSQAAFDGCASHLRTEFMRRNLPGWIREQPLDDGERVDTIVRAIQA